MMEADAIKDGIGMFASSRENDASEIDMEISVSLFEASSSDSEPFRSLVRY